MKKMKKTILGMFTVIAFALMMLFNVTTTDTGLDFSLCGETVLANDDEECQEVEDGGPTSLNYTGTIGHPLDCTYAGIGCVPCTSSSLPAED